MIDLSGIHYNDAILSVLFAGGFMFMGYSIHRFTKIDQTIARLEIRLMRKIEKANRKGARQVNAKFDGIVEAFKKENHK